VSGLEETDAPALAEVAEQIQLLVHEEFAIAVVKRPQIVDQAPFALVEGHWGDLDYALVEVEQRLVQGATEPERLEALKLPRLQLSPFNEGLQLLQLRNDLLL